MNRGAGRDINLFLTLRSCLSMSEECRSDVEETVDGECADMKEREERMECISDALCMANLEVSRVTEVGMASARDSADANESLILRVMVLLLESVFDRAFGAVLRANDLPLSTGLLIGAGFDIESGLGLVSSIRRSVSAVLKRPLRIARPLEGDLIEGFRPPGWMWEEEKQLVRMTRLSGVQVGAKGDSQHVWKAD